MERTRYTIAEARAALGGIDAKTILDWCEKADPKIEPVVDKRDQRRKFISTTDLARLAADHEREILPLDDAPKTLPAALKVIARQATLIAELRERVRVLEESEHTRTAKFALERATEAYVPETTWDISEPPAPVYRPPRKPQRVNDVHHPGVYVPPSDDPAKNGTAVGRIAEAHGANEQTVRKFWVPKMQPDERQDRAAVVRYTLAHYERNSQMDRWKHCDQGECVCHEIQPWSECRICVEKQ